MSQPHTYVLALTAEWNIVEALDHCYPYPQGSDAPAIVVPTQRETEDGLFLRFYTGKIQENWTYLMFKPKGEESEWVPLKVVHWIWEGAIEYSDDTRKWDQAKDGKNDENHKDDTKAPQDPTVEDTEDYPTWTRNTGDESAYSYKTY